MVVFDHTMPREKPCGGVVSVRTLRAFRFLAEVAEKVPVKRMRVLSPRDDEVVLESAEPVVVFARKTLDSFLLSRAQDGGAKFIGERVVEVKEAGGSWYLRTSTGTFTVDLVVGADGARSRVRGLLSEPVGRNMYRVTVGGYIPAMGSEEIFLKFMEDLPGYFWMMPRKDHAAVGVGTELRRARAKELFRVLDSYLTRYFNRSLGDCARCFVALAPWVESAEAFPAKCSHRNAALIGDAAMAVDPISGEGIFYALKSASLLATAILHGDLRDYDHLLQREVAPTLRAAAMRYSSFYNARYLSLLTLLARKNCRVRDAVTSVAFGAQGYDVLPIL